MKLDGIFVGVTKHGKKLNLAAWRAYRNLTQEQLEYRSGISQSTIWDIEDSPHKRRQPITLASLARALDTTPDKLYSDPFLMAPETGVEPEPVKFASKELEDRLKGRVTIDVNGVEVELTEEEKAKILAMAKILKGGG